jgi:hypothetical protein
MTTVHCAEVPEHAPLQPANTAPAFGEACNVTEVFVAYVSEQSVKPLPQLIPGPVTRPFPVTVTDSVAVVGAVVNVAVTLFDVLMTRVHIVPVPVHEPPQPVKLAPAFGVSVKVTDVFMA